MGRMNMTSEFCVAVHALVYLNHKGGTVRSEALAENICTNPARVRKVMARLGRAGLVETREGAEGGYLFTKRAEEVNLRQIGDALDTEYVGTSWHSGDRDMKCLVASGMADIMDGILGDLNETCRARLQAVTIAAIDSKIFGASEKGQQHETL